MRLGAHLTGAVRYCRDDESGALKHAQHRVWLLDVRLQHAADVCIKQRNARFVACLRKAAAHVRCLFLHFCGREASHELHALACAICRHKPRELDELLRGTFS